MTVETAIYSTAVNIAFQNATETTRRRPPLRHHLGAAEDALRGAHLAHEAHVAGEVGLSGGENPCGNGGGVEMIV